MSTFGGMVENSINFCVYLGFNKRKAQLGITIQESLFEERKSLWRNDCPIVLVHGFGGHTTDMNQIIGGYFHYCFQPEVSKGHAVYEADVSPFGSVHDRACELYQ